ncbi:hypothetical protein B0H14DRAFT_3493310 [Mycena olivaceomarginata]|nr:hypothetical protein B0H14DRAFT_3493310 [Mycena olivaceomarginata]
MYARGILSFGCYIAFLDPSVAPFLAETRAQRLALNLGSLFPPGSANLNLGHPLFRYVTYLDVFVFEGSSLVELLPDIPLLPALTHFALDSSPWESALRVLEECPRLKLLFIQWFDPSLYKHSQTPHAYDLRFVRGLCGNYWDDWELGSRGGADFLGPGG